MSIYATPLQFGYFFSLLMAVLFFYRGWQNQWLPYKLLGALMFILALELQDYTFGFSGINFLWEEMNGFPRGVNLLFGPALYFYLRSQINKSFNLKRKHAWHLLPWIAFFLPELIIFLQGSERVALYQAGPYSQILAWLHTLVLWLSYFYYFSKCIKLYANYKAFAVHQFSDQEAANLTWFRNFFFFMIIWVGTKEVMQVIDYIMDLSFYQDWWWNLPLVAAAIYVALSGLNQRKFSSLTFTGNDKDKDLEREHPYEENAQKLASIMLTQQLYLQPELTLKDIAASLNMPPLVVSNTINGKFQQNFNDYVNGLRVEEFIKRFKEGDARKITMLALAYDCGFNSKATFNRAFKKAKGCGPREYLKAAKRTF